MRRRRWMPVASSMRSPRRSERWTACRIASRRRSCCRFPPSHPVVTEARRDLSAHLAAIERDRAAEEQRAHGVRLAQLREQEEQARLAASATAVDDSETPTVVTEALADRVLTGR